MGAVVADDADLVIGEVGEAVSGEGEVPIAFVVAGGGVGVVVPIIEVADKGELVGVGSVFAVGPLLVGFVEEEAVGAVEGGLVFERGVAGALEEAVATAGNSVVVGREPRVVGDESQFFFHSG